jgi:hypothetical protein
MNLSSCKHDQYEYLINSSRFLFIVPGNRLLMGLRSEYARAQQQNNLRIDQHLASFPSLGDPIVAGMHLGYLAHVKPG